MRERVLHRAILLVLGVKEPYQHPGHEEQRAERRSYDPQVEAHRGAGIDEGHRELDRVRRYRKQRQDAREQVHLLAAHDAERLALHVVQHHAAPFSFKPR